MEAIRHSRSVFVPLLLCLLSLGMTPTTASARILTRRGIAILVPFTALLWYTSSNARSVGTKVYLKTKIAALRALRYCPLSEKNEKKCTTMIEDAEADYTLRSEAVTGDTLKALGKDFKELWDYFKAGKELYAWTE